MSDDFLNVLDGPQRPAPQPYEPRTTPLDDTARRYALAALAGEIANFTAVSIGSGRNHALNIAAFKMGGYIAAGAIDERTVTEALGAADGGLDYKETRDTIASGIKAGMASPKNIPETKDTSWLGLVSDGPPSDDPFSVNYSTTGTVTSISGGTVPRRGTNADVAPSTGEVTNITLANKVYANLPILDWFALWADESVEEWLSYPLLPARRLVAIYSLPKVGKSLLLLEMACAIARGTTAFGFKADKPYRVLYVDFENDPVGDIRTRLISMGLEPMDLDNLKYLSYPTLSALDTAAGAAELTAACQVYGVEVVVIDTVSRSIEGEENSNDTWISFYRNAGLALKRLGVAGVRLDHSGKDELKGQRGGSAKSGDVDAVWRMSRLTDGSDGRPETFRLTCEAKRFQLPPGDMILTLERHDNPLRHEVRAVGARSNIVDAIMAYLDVQGVPLSRGRSAELLAEVKAGGVPGASKATLEEALKARKAAIEAGALIESSDE